ncbi:hypothetical protein Tco_0966298 [Tanacetum coccineum]
MKVTSLEQSDWSYVVLFFQCLEARIAESLGKVDGVFCSRRWVIGGIFCEILNEPPVKNGMTRKLLIPSDGGGMSMWSKRRGIVLGKEFPKDRRSHPIKDLSSSQPVMKIANITALKCLEALPKPKRHATVGQSIPSGQVNCSLF